jgi:Flp pilus assembly protein TadG
MSSISNEKGSVLVFITLMIVLLMIMVGMGLDTGQLTYSRSMGQGAVDAAALSAVSGLPSRTPSVVEARAAAFISKNNYVGSNTNTIQSKNVSYVKYDFTTNKITNYSEPIATANGVRVALEQATNSAIATPAFLTPLFNLFGISTAGANNVNVSAVATITARPAIPIVLWSNVCNLTPGSSVDIKMQHPDKKDDEGSENACWTTFFDCSSGAPDIKAGFNVAESCSGSRISGDLKIGSLICQNRGQVNTVIDYAEKFFDGHPEQDCWIVPVITGGGNCDPNNPTGITDFAKICPTTIFKNGAHSYIRANVTCNQSLADLDSSLCFSHRLVREPAKGY